MPSLPPSTPPKGLPEALPAWKLDAESWIFPFYSGPATLKENRAVAVQQATNKNGGGGDLAKRQGIEQGGYHPLEDVKHIGSDVFRGGLGGWILYRYASSPAGPYDELIYVAGSFNSKASNTRGLRITNIYVSTEASVWNGRRNWNIPKHLARFEWSHGFRDNTSAEQAVSVYHAGGAAHLSDAPFFSASLQRSRWLPSIPINTRILPSLPLYQPPLRAGVYSAPHSSVERDSAPHNVYRSTAPTFSGWCTLAYSKPLLNKRTACGDARGFPAAKNTWGIGVYLPSVTVDFPWSKEYEAKL